MSEKDYEVGYKRPPKHTRFKKGRSGNPKGRPKGAKNLATDIAEELGETIVVTENGRRRRLSKQRAMLKTLSTKGLKGEVRAIAKLLDMAERHCLGDEDIEHVQPLAPDD